MVSPVCVVVVPLLELTTIGPLAIDMVRWTFHTICAGVLAAKRQRDFGGGVPPHDAPEKCAEAEQTNNKYQ
jgi:hypothetical protein